MTAIDRFVAWWFRPIDISCFEWTRVLLAIACAGYFVGGMTDLSVWFGDAGWLRTDHVAGFLRLADLSSEAQTSISALFLTDRSWGYCLHLIIGCTLSVLWVLPMAGKHRSWIGAILWLCVAMWANRLLWVAGWSDKVLSMSVFVIALAGMRPRSSFEAFAVRLFACQTTCVLAMTTATMLAWDVWWDGTGSVALAANTGNRVLDLTGWLTIRPWFYEGITHALIVVPILGLMLLWTGPGSQVQRNLGTGALISWCVCVALLGNHWLLGLVIASGILAVRACRCQLVTPAGTDN
ncbi:MAG: hypothetical protein AAGD07_15835 [Planctomycetota bacterium]